MVCTEIHPRDVLPLIKNALLQFNAKQSDDPVKRDLELRCTVCNAHVCDVEDDDSLYVLVATAFDDHRECGVYIQCCSCSRFYDDVEQDDTIQTATAAALDEGWTKDSEGDLMCPGCSP